MFSPAFVVLLGLGTVFVGLIIIILLCKLMSFFVGITEKNTKPATQAAAVQSAPQDINDKPALIAAISAVVAEELGTEISNIRIHSIKRV